MASTSGPVTRLLVAWTNGDGAALEELIPVSPATVKRQWTVARAWLLANLEAGARS